MYTFSSKLRNFSFVLMILGILGIGYGFLSAPKNIEEVEKILAADAHGHHDLVRSWSTIVELISVYKRLRAFEAQIGKLKQPENQAS